MGKQSKKRMIHFTQDQMPMMVLMNGEKYVHVWQVVRDMHLANQDELLQLVTYFKIEIHAIPLPIRKFGLYFKQECIEIAQTCYHAGMDFLATPLPEGASPVVTLHSKPGWSSHIQDGSIDQLAFDFFPPS